MNRVMTARPDPHAARAYWTMSRGDSARAFHSARRHSRIVRVMRIAIPLVVLAALASISAVAYFNPMRMLKKLPIDVSNLVVNGSKITMEQPRMSGFTSDARLYELSADSAAQDLTRPDLVELRNMHAKIEMQDKTTIEMAAASGLYDNKGETLKLERDIRLSSSNGYKGRLTQAVVDIKNGNVTSDQPVEIELLQGTLNAKRLDIINSGDLVRFHGGVTMILMLSEADKAKAGITR